MTSKPDPSMASRRPRQVTETTEGLDNLLDFTTVTGNTTSTDYDHKDAAGCLLLCLNLFAYCRAGNRRGAGVFAYTSGKDGRAMAFSTLCAIDPPQA